MQRKDALGSGRARWIALLGAAALFTSSTASAVFTCEGKVTYLAVNPNGAVNLAVNGYGVWGICNVSNPITLTDGGTFTAEACRALFSSALAAQKSGTGIRLYFNTSATSSNGPECTALGSWVAPNPSAYHYTILDQ